MPTQRYPTLPPSVLLHLLLAISLAFLWQTAHAQPSKTDGSISIEQIHVRSQQQNYPDLTRTDSDANRAHILSVLRDAATYEGAYGSLVDAIAAEPFYKSPSRHGRSVSAGSVARRLQTYHEAISGGARINKLAISAVITEWKSEMEGYEAAVRASRVNAYMGQAMRHQVWVLSLRQ